MLLAQTILRITWLGYPHSQKYSKLYSSSQSSQWLRIMCFSNKNNSWCIQLTYLYIRYSFGYKNWQVATHFTCSVWLFKESLEVQNNNTNLILQLVPHKIKMTVTQLCEKYQVFQRSQREKNNWGYLIRCNKLLFIQWVDGIKKLIQINAKPHAMHSALLI